MLSLLVSAIDAELTPPQEAQIQRHRDGIGAISDDRDAYLTKIDSAWATAMTQMGIHPLKVDADKDAEVLR